LEERRATECEEGEELGMRSNLSRLGPRMPRMAKRAPAHAVTLVIYGWHESEPGTLAWVFPSVNAALRAVRAMRNAVRWVIIEGIRVFDREIEIDVDALRRAGGVLLEQAT
jgi:hypothetical protein